MKQSSLDTLAKKAFFGQFFSQSKAVEKSLPTEQKNHEQATLVIQRWWKQLQLKQTATESFEYVNHVVSLQQAQKNSFTKLEESIVDEKTQKTTRTLLMHLEQAKDLILPSRSRLPNLPGTDRIFLSAYLIATKSEHLFESPSDIDARLLAQAEAMLKSFETLCTVMSETYKEKSVTLSAATTEKTPSADQVLARLETFQKTLLSERMKMDQHFMAEGRKYLEAFHQNQLAYYETFSHWESNNRQKLAKICIAYYLKLELKRFVIMNNLDPRQIELYEGYGAQQKTLKKRVINLLGDEGSKLLELNLQELQEILEANKWINSPAESLIHELALNPEFELPADSCTIKPAKGFDTAITALVKESPDIEPMLDVLGEIGRQIALFTPNNKRHLEELQQKLSRTAIKEQIASTGYQGVLYQVIYSLIEKIKDLESPAHVPETTTFLGELNTKISDPEQNHTLLLKQALAFIYRKMSQINLEMTNFHIQQARGLIARNIVAFEQQKFQERLSKNQFDLTLVLSWIDKMVSTPKDYQLDLPILCSQYVASYIAPTILIGMLQQPEPSILHTIPETFYLDRVRLECWHAKYQHIFYTIAALGYLETTCAKYGIKITPDELLKQKEMLMTALETGEFTTAKQTAQYLEFVLNELLGAQKKKLGSLEEPFLKQLMEDIYQGNRQVAKLINKRLGDKLSCYFFKGHLPESSNTTIKWYGLEKELKQLGQEIRPLLQLHIKVHGEFYHQRVEERLWKPLCATLAETQIPTALPPLLATAEEQIKHTHECLHKMAFVLTGLALIQQTVMYADMWNLKVAMKNSTLKDLAYSFGLIDMVKNTHASKNMIAERLMELMKHVAREQELTFEKTDERKLAKMILLAKKEQSPGYRAFLDELVILYRQSILKNKTSNPNSNSLTAEFKEEVLRLGTEVREIISTIKKDLIPGDTDPVSQTIPILRAGRESAANTF